MSRDTEAGKATVVQLCAALLLSRSAYYAAREAMAVEAALVVATAPVSSPPSPAAVASAPADEASPPVASPRRSEAWVRDATLREAVTAVVAAHPAWGGRKVYRALRRAPYAFRTSRKRVVAMMKSLGLMFAGHEAREAHLFGHVSVPECNRRWSIDLTTAFTKRDGWVAVVPVVDCGCRSVLELEVTKVQDSAHVLVPLRRALEEVFGAVDEVPEGFELRSDNGSQFTGYDCERLCRSWRVEQTFSPPGRPTGNSVVERLIRTMKEECVWLRDWESAEELRGALLAWREAYNTVRPHQALNWATPSERRAELMASRPLAA